MLQVFSSYADDIIAYRNNKLVAGGPAFWIKKTFDELDVSYTLHTGNKSGVVRIDKDGNGEDRGYILSTSEIPFSSVSEDDIVLLSTLKHEFDLQKLETVKNTICIDLQGFLRGDDGKKQRFDCRNIFSQGEIFIKVTRDEFSYLEHHENASHTFIITNGGNEIEILGPGLNIIIPTLAGKFSDTIGAGDTFLASFVVFYSLSKDIKDAVEQASYYTYRFLTGKNTLRLK